MILWSKYQRQPDVGSLICVVAVDGLWAQGSASTHGCAGWLVHVPVEFAPLRYQSGLVYGNHTYVIIIHHYQIHPKGLNNQFLFILRVNVFIYVASEWVDGYSYSSPFYHGSISIARQEHWGIQLKCRSRSWHYTTGLWQYKINKVFCAISRLHQKPLPKLCFLQVYVAPCDRLLHWTGLSWL